LKIEKISLKDEREGAGITRYGNSSYKAIGFKITAENEEDQKFLDDFFILWEDSNGYIETDTELERNFLNIYTFKGW